MSTYFGFAISDSMFNGNVVVKRNTLTFEEAKALIEEEGVIPCLNPSHKATIDAMVARGISIDIPDTPPRVSLGIGDSMIVMGVRGLPRLTDRHEYTEDEVADATFTFSVWKITCGTC